jgi:hypothetical protein
MMHREPGALGRQREGDGTADLPPGACDQGDPAVEAEGSRRIWQSGHSDGPSAKRTKVFCFFFSKKKALSFLKKRNKKLFIR